MKQRFSYLDLKLIVNEIEKDLENSRLQNIYTLEASQRFFLFKFDTKQDGKAFMLVDPGMRLHMTKFQHQATLQPTGFVSKLRKHLRNMRVNRLWVPSGNRALVISFGDDHYRLIFEFFAGGNIILTDGQNKTLALMRVVKNMAGEVVYGVGLQVAMEGKFIAPLDRETVENAQGKEKMGRFIHSKLSNPSLSMVEYCLEKHGVDPKAKTGDVDAIMAAVTECNAWFNSLTTKDTTPGYILRQNESSLEFEPFKEYFETVIEKKPQEDSKELSVTEYPTYNNTVDEYYGAILAGKQENQLDQIYKVAETRLEAAKNERKNRIRGLDVVQTQNERMGTALQENAELVDAAIAAVKGLVEQGLDWGDIENIIALEKSKRNKMALIIGKLDLDKDSMVLQLPDSGADSDEDSDHDSDSESDDGSDSKPSGTIGVKVKLFQGAWANARDYFAIRRAAGAKKEKTEQQANKALKSAEVKIKRDLENSLKKSATKSRILHVRRSQHWFEKFYWFLTSDGHIAIAGHDSLQNEILLTRYFGKNDYYVHTDISDASVVLIKNDQGTEISPKALNEAAAFSIATSKAWETKSPGNAWYTTRDQVPRLNKKGDPISVSEVSIAVKRTTILPNSFDVGFCLLFETKTAEDDIDPSPQQGTGKESQESDSDEEFPDTQVDSDDEFPDTQVDSNVDDSNEGNEEESSDGDSDAEELSKDRSEPLESTLESSAAEPFEDPIEPESTATDAQDPDKTGGSVDSRADTPSSDCDDLESVTESVSSLSTKSVPKRVRGNKKKLKKYLDQDEEDRKAAMERIGTLKGLERQERIQQEKEEQKQKELAYKQMRKERARQADLKRIAAEVVEETPFPSNISNTIPEDEDLVAIVPMFGPWSGMQSAAFKIKVVPGTQKKGKATSEVLRLMADCKKMTQKQSDLYGGITSNDLQVILPMSRLQVGKPSGAKAGAKGAAARGSKAAKGGKKGKK